jgi:hypothetical protein
VVVMRQLSGNRGLPLCVWGVAWLVPAVETAATTAESLPSQAPGRRLVRDSGHRRRITGG